MLEELKPKAVALNNDVEQAEAAMLNMNQVDCPVAHHFGSGIYIREVTLPAGIFAIGHKQKFKHLNVMISGKICVVQNGQLKILTAPLTFVGESGRKFGYIIETCVWQNIYATEETDIDKLEAHYLDKSDTFNAYEKELNEFNRISNEDDRLDYKNFLTQSSFTEQEILEVSVNESDQIPMPLPWNSITSVRKSSIQGKGLFLSFPANKNYIIAPALINGMRTPAGRYTNHSKNPNCKFVRHSNGDIYLISIKPISGCKGGSKGEELTVDYRNSLQFTIGGK